MRTEWPKNTARPIARAAKVRLPALFLLTAVSKTARTRRHVNTTSPAKALPVVVFPPNPLQATPGPPAGVVMLPITVATPKVW